MDSINNGNSKKSVERIAALTSAVTSAGASIGTTSDTLAAKAIIQAGGRIEQRVPNSIGETEVAALIAEIGKMRRDWAVELARKGAKGKDLAEKIVLILKAASISVQLSGFADPQIFSQLRETIEQFLHRDEPVFLAMLMGGGKIPNTLKTGSAVLPDLAEWVALTMLEAITEPISQIYSPGAVVVVIPDALLHTADLGTSVEEAIAHHKTLRKDLGTLGVTHVRIPDVLPLLDAEWMKTTDSFLAEARRKCASDPAFQHSLRRQVDSLVYSINTRVIGRSFEEDVLAFAAVAGHVGGLSSVHRMRGTELYRRAEDIVHRYVATNWAIRRTNLVAKAVAGLNRTGHHLRMSVHAKKGEPRPLLFKSSSYFPNVIGLLPMHSVGVRHVGDKTRFGAAFELTARLRQWTPILNPAGRFLYYESTDPDLAESAGAMPSANTGPEQHTNQ